MQTTTETAAIAISRNREVVSYGMKTKTKTRIASRTETLKLRNKTMPVMDYVEAELDDGHKNATRLLLNAETGEPMMNKDGSQRYCAPWLLSDFFSV